MEDPKWPGELLRLDFLGPIRPKSQGKSYILVLIDHLTRWSWAVGCNACKTENVIPGLVEWIRQRGMPKRIFSDQGPHYTSDTFAIWCIERRYRPHSGWPGLTQIRGPCRTYQPNSIGASSVVWVMTAGSRIGLF